MLLASAVAFRLFLWLLPLALLAAGILAAVAKDNSASLESASKAAGLAGAASQQVVAALREGNKSWWVAVVAGAVLFLWGTRTLMRNLRVVNAHAWAAPVPKPGQKHLLVTTLVFAVGWILLFIVAGAVSRLDRLIGVVLTTGVESVAVAAVWLVISVRLPDRRTDMVDLLPGCLLFGVGVAVMNAVSRVYLPRAFAQSSQLYGTLGIASVILGWLLLIGQLIVSAAVVNAVWSDYRADRHAGPSSPTQRAARE